MCNTKKIEIASKQRHLSVNERNLNEMENKFLVAGDKFVLEMHLRQPGALCKIRYTYSTCRPFTKSKENTEIQRNRGFTINLSRRIR